MTARNTLVGLALALPALAPTLSAQVAAPESRAATESIDDLIEQLGDDQFAVRKAATKRLTELGEKAVADLRAAAEDHDDPEVRMRAGRILGRAEQRAADQRGGLNRRRSPLVRDGVGEGEIRRILEQMLEERFPGRKLLDQALQGIDTLEPGATKSNSERVSIQIGPDGVRCEVESGEDGEASTKVYEAPDIESFRAQHPDLARRHLDGELRRSWDLNMPRVFAPKLFQRPFDIQVDPPKLDLDLGQGRTLPQVVQPRWEVDEGAAAVPAKGRLLGVQVANVHPAVAEFLGFEAGHGIKVNAVEADSLAADLGVRVGDVLLEIGERAIQGRGDVADALGAIEAGETVEVTVNRRGREVELSATKRDTADAPVETDDDAKRGRKLRRR